MCIRDSDNNDGYGYENSVGSCLTQNHYAPPRGASERTNRGSYYEAVDFEGLPTQARGSYTAQEVQDHWANMGSVNTETGVYGNGNASRVELVREGNNSFLRTHHPRGGVNAGQTGAQWKVTFPHSRSDLYVSYRVRFRSCLLYTSPSPRDATLSRMPSSA